MAFYFRCLNHECKDYYKLKFWTDVSNGVSHGRVYRTCMECGDDLAECEEMPERVPVMPRLSIEPDEVVTPHLESYVPKHADFQVEDVDRGRPGLGDYMDSMVREVERIALSEADKRRLFHIESKLRVAFRELIALLDEMRGFGD